jgi:DNA polymerase-3 subunit gamma/tau
VHDHLNIKKTHLIKCVFCFKEGKLIMSYMALYRKWRPLKFDDVVEQEYIIKILKNAIAQNRIGHAYLFCGTRGTGKTTLAKIFSRAINCENPHDSNPCNECETCKGIISGSILDVLEIDAASNNSVDNIREIRDEVIYSPSKAKYKVYIIDEVHMLSTGAFNALLKTLEEPPPHIVFILATTEAHKLPVTILSRCQRYDFKRISIKSISLRIKEISDSNNISLNENAANLIAKLADGALRDGISILDQCLSLPKEEITLDDVVSVVGVVDINILANISDNIFNNNINSILEIIDSLTNYGKNLGKFITDLIEYFRNILIYKVSNNAENLVEFTDESLNKLGEQTKYWSIEEISLIIKNLSSLENSIKWSVHPKTLIEVELIKLSDKNYFNNQLNIEEKISALESKINNFKNIQVKTIAPVNEAKKVTRENIPKKDFKINKKHYIQNWMDILNLLKTQKRFLYQILKETNAVLKNKNNVEVIVYNTNKINKEKLENPENIELIQKIVSEQLKEKINIKFSFRVQNSEYETDNFENKLDSFEKDDAVNLNLFDKND